MSTGALVMMIFWEGTVTLMTGYFFYRVLTSKRKPENPADKDSFSNNDDDSNLNIS